MSPTTVRDLDPHRRFRRSAAIARGGMSCVVWVSTLLAGTARSAEWGVFEGRVDVGAPRHAGAVAFDAGRGTYTVTGGGANMWSTNDALHFVWKKMSGDVA
ncbi:MAG: hypothetical protein JNL97_02145, partial [Verrucomicrobiales bacterium]|nr:hypothetical protein [Verrucomicrobiales bacterium]